MKQTLKITISEFERRLPYSPIISLIYREISEIRLDLSY